MEKNDFAKQKVTLLYSGRLRIEDKVTPKIQLFQYDNEIVYCNSNSFVLRMTLPSILPTRLAGRSVPFHLRTNGPNADPLSIPQRTSTIIDKP